MDYIPNIITAMWPTPEASIAQSGGPSDMTKRKEAGHGQPTRACLHGGNSFGCLALTEKFVARLTTLSAWLMGYTGAYLGLWETASSHKSRQK
jgi:hypothetical protein